MWESVKWGIEIFKHKGKIWKWIKSTGNYLKVICTCPQRLNNHEDRLTALEKNNSIPEKISQTGNVTIAEIDETIKLVARAMNIGASMTEQDYYYSCAEEIEKAYRHVKVLYHRLLDQEITPPPPENLTFVDDFKYSEMKIWYEYLLELKVYYKKHTPIPM